MGGGVINNKIRAFIFSPLLDYVLGLCYVMDVKKKLYQVTATPLYGGPGLLMYYMAP